MNYTNEASLKAAFGDAEAAGLTQDAPGVQDAARLEKAASAATDEINNWLRTAGYVVPLVFTPYGETLDVGDPPFLPAQLQNLSDSFTAFHLAAATDLSKKKYEELRAAGLAWLEDVRMAKIRLDLPKTVEISGAGEVKTVARPSVFHKYLRRESDIFSRN